MGSNEARNNIMERGNVARHRVVNMTLVHVSGSAPKLPGMPFRHACDAAYFELKQRPCSRIRETWPLSAQLRSVG
jgi:hypothetical protein